MHANPHAPDRARAALRWLALFGAALLLGCPPEDEPTGTEAVVLSAAPPPLLPPDATAGLAQHELNQRVEVPGGVVDGSDGNLVIRRVDLSVDGILGRFELGAVYNSASGEWLWSHQIYYDGEVFLDPDGCEWSGLSLLPDGSPLHGSIWTRIDPDTIASRGGREHHFDANGALQRISWRGFDYPRIEFSPGEISQCTSPGVCTRLFTLTPGPGGNPLAIVEERSGRTALFDYDASGRLVTARDALDVARGWLGFRYEYTPGDTLLSALVSSEGARIEFDYQSGRRVHRVTQIGEGDPQHVFDFLPWDSASERWPTLHTNPLGGVTRQAFDAERRLREVVREATGEIARLEYPGASQRPSSITRPSGATLAFTWNADDELATSTLPSGNVLHFTYASNGLNFETPSERPVAKIEDVLGLVEERDYDALGRLETVRNGCGETVTYGYTRTLLTSALSPAGIPLHFPHFGAHGHALETRGGIEDRHTYDRVGNVLVSSLIFEEGGLVARRYDEDRRLAALELAATEGNTATSQGELLVERRSEGSIQRVARPYGGEHEFVYDALGRPVEARHYSEGQWRTTTRGYDAAGNLLHVEHPNGMRQEFTWDVYGRRTAIRAYRDGALEGSVTLTYRDGLLHSKSDSLRGTTTSYVYDSAERVHVVFHGLGEATMRVYDERSRVVREWLLVPTTILQARFDYEYDLADRLIEIRDGLEGEMLLERHYAEGRLVGRSFGNGLSRSFFYDPESGVPVGAELRDESGALVAETLVTVTEEIEPPRQQLTNTVDSPLGVTTEAYWMRLGGGGNSAQPLGGRRVFHWENDAGAALDFAHDELGNRVSDASGNDFFYDAERSRLLWAQPAGAAPGVSYAYDEAGFVTSRDGATIGWSASGRIAHHGADTFEWDMFGAPIAITRGGFTRRFELFEGRVESDAQTGSLGSIQLAPELSVDLGSGGRIYRHPDFRSNVSYVSDESGAIVAHYRYRPYGVDAALGISDPAATFARGTEVGPLLLMGARVYDPLAGRFLSPDPLLQLRSQYTWTSGNPVLFADQTGFMSEIAVSWGAQASVFIKFGITAVGVGAGISAVGGGPLGLAVVAGGVAAISAGALLAVGSAILSATSTPAAAPSAPGPTGGGPGPGAAPANAAGLGNVPLGVGAGGGGSGQVKKLEVRAEVDLGIGVGVGMGGIGGGLAGGTASCGLLGVEPLAFVAYLLARRRRRRA